MVPESTAAKQKLTVRVAGAGEETAGRTVVSDYVSEEHWYTRARSDGHDVHAPAGSVVLQNNLNFHAATVRQSVVPRVTLHTIFASTAGRHGVGYADSRVSELAGGEGEGGGFRHEVVIGLGHIVALHYCSSTLYPIR